MTIFERNVRFRKLFNCAYFIYMYMMYIFYGRRELQRWCWSPANIRVS